MSPTATRVRPPTSLVTEGEWARLALGRVGEAAARSLPDAHVTELHVTHLVYYVIRVALTSGACV